MPHAGSIATHPRQLARLSVLAALAFLIACDTATSTDLEIVSEASVASKMPPFPAAADFVPAVTNPYFPLVPGTVFSYRSEDETGTVVVTGQAKTVFGIAVTVVHDQVFTGGNLSEDTFDYYAQDKAGNVWYLGEASCEIVNGQCVSTEGSWEAGVNGGQPGIIMWADPAAHKGETYRQEFSAGVAEDMAKVLNVNVSVNVPFGKFTGCVETMDFSALDLGAKEHKFYCAGYGVVLEAQANGKGRNELVGISKP